MTLVKPKRYKHWQVRVRVPETLQAYVGKRELWASTGTTDKVVATRRARTIYDRFDRLLDQARAARAKVSIEEVSVDRLIQTAREVHQATLAQYSDAIIMQEPLEGLDYELDAYLEIIQDREPIDGVVYRAAPSPEIVEEIREVLARRGIEAPGNGEAFEKAIMFYCRAKASALAMAIAHAGGDLTFTSPDPVVSAKPEKAEPVGAGITTVRDLIALHTHDPSRANVGAAVKKQYEPSYRLLVETVGETTPVDQVTREDARRVRERLIERKLADATVNSYLSHLSSLWLYAVREGYVDKNVFERMAIKAKVADKDLRVPYSATALRRIFTSEQWRACGAERPSLYWCPLLSLFCSLRMTEAAQLLVGDVKQVQGVWVVEVAPGEGKKVKSSSSKRQVPLHPALIAAGLLDYVRSRNDPDGRLFPDVPLNAYGTADALGKRWARLVATLNAKEDRTGYHSLRHCWADACRNARVPESVWQQAGGWSSNGGVSARYGAGFDIAVVAEELAKIKPMPEDVQLL